MCTNWCGKLSICLLLENWRAGNWGVLRSDIGHFQELWVGIHSVLPVQRLNQPAANPQQTVTQQRGRHLRLPPAPPSKLTQVSRLYSLQAELCTGASIGSVEVQVACQPPGFTTVQILWAHTAKKKQTKSTLTKEDGPISNNRFALGHQLGRHSSANPRGWHCRGESGLRRRQVTNRLFSDETLEELVVVMLLITVSVFYSSFCAHLITCYISLYANTQVPSFRPPKICPGAEKTVDWQNN